MILRPRAVTGLFLLSGSVLLALLLSTGVVASPSDEDKEPDTSQESEPSDPPGSCSPEEAIQEDLLGRDFDRLEFSVRDTVWAQNPLDHVGGAFHGRIETRNELSRFLRGDAPESRGTRDRVLTEIPEGERVPALSGKGYVDVQFHVPVDYTGNSVWNGDRVITPNGVKRAKTGDVVWVYVTQDCDVIWSASVRADCGNVGYRDLVPVRKD